MLHRRRGSSGAICSCSRAPQKKDSTNPRDTSLRTTEGSHRSTHFSCGANGVARASAALQWSRGRESRTAHYDSSAISRRCPYGIAGRALNFLSLSDSKMELAVGGSGWAGWLGLRAGQSVAGVRTPRAGGVQLDVGLPVLAGFAGGAQAVADKGQVVMGISMVGVEVHRDAQVLP
jgi:hypothetical protein